MLNIADLSVRKIICLMIRFYGFVYYVRVERADSHKEYVVKVNHLEEFVALMDKFDAVIVTELLKTHVNFEHKFQWYKSL